ncbi:hypothetical protein, partial [Burkholderia sp. A1]|uniref:hypothetical protein n=1 Tax=Burkholderia sp. A1 TaxID=148446 RepID=UPI001A7E44DB
MPITSGRSKLSVKRPHCSDGGRIGWETLKSNDPEAETKRAGVIHTSPSIGIPWRDYAGAVALPGLTSAPAPPEGSLAGGTLPLLFGERGGGPALMSLIWSASMGF